MKSTVTLAAAAGIAIFSLASPTVAQLTPSEESLSDLYPGKVYSPYAQRRFPNRPLWGDSHLHTALSLDAGLFGAWLGLEEAYLFARGEEVISSTGQPVKLARFSFVQAYFSTDRHDPDTETMTRKVLQALSAGGNSPLEAERGYGDQSMLGYAYENESIADISRKFGQDFADAIALLPPERWHGPIASGYGLHLVYIQDHTPARAPTLAEVRDAVRRDYANRRNKKMRHRLFMNSSNNAIVSTSMRPPSKRLTTVS